MVITLNLNTWTRTIIEKHKFFLRVRSLPWAGRRVSYGGGFWVEELYDLSLDPYELNNVAYKAEYREILNELRAQLDQWMKQQGDRGLEGELAVKARGGLSQ